MRTTLILIVVSVSCGTSEPGKPSEVPQQGGAAQELKAVKVKTLPAVDGKADDEAWKSAREFVVKIDVPSNLDDPKKKVTLKAVHDGESIAFLLVWEDAKANVSHEPYVWNKDKKEYELPEKNDVEDGAILAFQHTGEFNPNMLAGIESKWDVWQWKAALTNSKGYAQDKVHIYSKTKLVGVRANALEDDNSKPLWIARPEDAGTPVTKLLDWPSEYKGDKAPRYEAQEPAGSAADVRAKGEWKDGRWTVEFLRKLKTGHDDDRAFAPGESLGFAVGVLDEYEGMDHYVSLGLKLTVKR